MLRKFQSFTRGLATNWIGTAGVVLTTSAFILFIFLELLRLIGVVTNAYVGLVAYLLLPALFMLGLVLIPIGWHRYKQATGLSTTELLSRRFSPEMTDSKPLGSSLLGMISGLTLLNLLFLGLGGASMLHFMDKPEFCGTACHKVMHPEWTAYQDSPHAHVRCVDCHVGEGTAALIDAKLNGMWQIVSATFDLYDRPIPTPVHQLRPARETCEKCHWPEKFYGKHIKVITHFDFDHESTPRYSTLSLKIGSGSGESGEIHWHVASTNKVRYASVDDERKQMLWVEVSKGDDYWRYTNKRLAFQTDEGEEQLAHIRTLDCVDCHNRATHIYEDPEKAVDERIANGSIARSLPFAKRKALQALTGNYPNLKAAREGIENSVRGFYARTYRSESIAWQDEIDAMIATLQDAYERNIFPQMNVTWNSYPDYMGHHKDSGCFRCHNQNLVDSYGQPIPYDCTLCHSILSYDSHDKFQFLQPVREEDPDREMHKYLQAEFLGSNP